MPSTQGYTLTSVFQMRAQETAAWTANSPNRIILLTKTYILGQLIEILLKNILASHTLNQHFNYFLSTPIEKAQQIAKMKQILETRFKFPELN